MIDTDIALPSAGTRRLATALSVASRIEPELIRAVRLEVFPGLDVGHESELWFSELIGSREPRAIALRPDLLPTLRADLAASLAAAGPDDPIRRMRDLISQAHVGLPPALRLEEEINWLSVARQPGHVDDIDEALEEALRALVDGGRGGIADWYVGALGRLPSEVRQTRTAWLLATVTAQRYPGAAPSTAPTGLRTVDVQRIADHLGEELLGLTWDGPDLLISGRPGDEPVAVPVPATDPRVIDVVIGQRTETVLVGANDTVRVAAAGGPVQLQTAAGTTFDIAGAEQLALVRRLAEEVGPAEFATVRELLPVTGILDAMVALADADVRLFEVRLSPDAHQQAADAFPAVARLLRQGFQQALRDQGRANPGEPAIVFLADPDVPPGEFAVRARQAVLPAEPPAPSGPVDRDRAIQRSTQWFVSWLSDQIDAEIASLAGPLARRLLVAADASGIRASSTASAGILANVYRAGLLQGPATEREEKLADDLRQLALRNETLRRGLALVTAMEQGLSLAVRHFAELRGCSVFGDGRARVLLDADSDLITCDFRDDVQPGESTRAVGLWAAPPTQPRLVDEQGIQIMLKPGLMTIGRDPSADIRLPDPWIADRHAEVNTTVDSVTIRLLSTANGIMVNGVAVDETALTDGDVIALGAGRLIFRWLQAGEQLEPMAVGSRLIRPGELTAEIAHIRRPSGPPMAIRPARPFRRAGFRRGYDVTEVNEFLDRVQQFMDTGSPRVTPAELRAMEFRMRRNGYDETEVDEHLDKLSDFLGERERDA